MESVVRILHFITLIWVTGSLEQQYIMAAITVIKFQAGTKLHMKSHKILLCVFDGCRGSCKIMTQVIKRECQLPCKTV